MKRMGLEGVSKCKIAFGEGLEMHGKHPSGVIAVYVKRPGESVWGFSEGLEAGRKQRTGVWGGIGRGRKIKNY